MSRLGVWRIRGRGPERVQPATIGFEAHLEDWIERDPALLEAGCGSRRGVNDGRATRGHGVAESSPRLSAVRS